MGKSNNLDDFLTDLANTIREKKGTNEPINAQDFSSEIASIQSSTPEKVIYTGPLCIGNKDYGATDISDPDDKGKRTINLSIVNEVNTIWGTIYKCHANDYNPYTSEEFKGVVDYDVTINLDEATIPHSFGKGKIVLTINNNYMGGYVSRGDSRLTANVSLTAYELV